MPILDKPSRNEVFSAISSERDYQRKKFNLEDDKNKSLADWLLDIEYQLVKAKNDNYNLFPSDVLDEIRKIAALCTACMEYNGVVLRET